jgi:hypothetical protein
MPVANPSSRTFVMINSPRGRCHTCGDYIVSWEVPDVPEPQLRHRMLALSWVVPNGYRIQGPKSSSRAPGRPVPAGGSLCVWRTRRDGWGLFLASDPT